MFRYICTVFVALTICQAAFASDATQRKIVELEVAEQMSRTIDLFDTEIKSSSNVGDFILGNRMAGEYVYSFDYEYENNEYAILFLELHVPIPAGRRIHYMSARNRDDSNVVICGNRTSLEHNKAVVVLRIPRYMKAKINVIIAAY